MRAVLLPATVAAILGAQAVPTLREALADLDAGRLQPAEQKLTQIARQNPTSADAFLHLGIARFRLRLLARALEALEKAVQLAPDRALAWKALGTVHAAQGDYKSAEAPFRKACDLDPREEDACYYFGRNYYQLNRFEAALAAYEKALPDDGHSWRVHNGMALAFEGLARPEEAEKQFRLATELYNDRGRPDENPRIDLGAFLYKQGRVDEALVQLEQAVASSPESPRARLELAKVLVHKERLEEAARHLEKAIEREPGHAAAHLLLGKVYYRLGRAEDGARHMKLGAAAAP